MVAQLSHQNDIAIARDAGTVRAPAEPANFLVSGDAETVRNYGRDGSDLVIEFDDGTTLRIEGFFTNGIQANTLVFIQDDGRWLANFDPALAGPDGIADDSVVLEKIGDDDSTLILLGLLGAGLAGAIAATGGNDDKPEAARDTLPPSRPVFAADDDVGLPAGPIAHRSTTNDANPTLSGNADPGSIIHIYDNGRLIGTAQAGADGSWTFTPSPPLTDGQHLLTATATDAAGNISPPSVLLDIRVDTTSGAPSITVTGQADGTITVSGSAEPGATVTITYPDGTSGTVIADPTGHYSITSPGVQTSGTVTAEATDAAGNDGPPASSAYVDGTGPAAPSITVTGQGDGTITVSGSAEPGATFTITYPDGTSGTVIADPTGHYSITSPGVQTSGTVTAEATDAAGNDGPPASSAYVDGTGPAAPSITVTGQGDGTITVSGSAEPGATVTITYPDGTSGTVIADPTGHYSITSPGVQTSGTVTAEATDAAGNDGPPASSAYVDGTGPAAPSITVTGQGDGTITVSGSAEPGATVTITYPDGTSGTVIADPTGHYSITSPGVQTSGTVTAEATDAAGNDGPPASSAYVDGTGPAAPSITVTGQGDGTITVSGSAEPGATVTITYPDGTSGTVIADPTGHYSITSPGVQTSGTVTAEATDAAGNDGPPASSAYVDGTGPAAPSITVTGQGDGTITVSGSAEPGATVTITYPDGTSGTVIADPTGHYSIISPGVQTTGTVTAEATDAAGNDGPPASSAYVDGTGPAAPSITVTGQADGRITVSGSAEPGATVTITYPDGTSGTVIADPTGHYSITSPGVQTSGTVTAEATDAAGNDGPPASSAYVDGTGPAATATITTFTDNQPQNTGDLVNGAVTNDGEPLLKGNVSGLADGDTVRVYEGATLVGTAAVVGNTWSLQLGALGEGGHSYIALVADKAGNEGTSSSVLSLTVDTSITTGTLSLANFTDSGISASDGLTQDSTFDLSLAGTEAGAGIVYQVSQDAGVSWTDTVTAQSSLADGTYLYRAIATDAAGNSAASNIVTVTVDTSITAGTLTLSNFSDTGAFASDGLTQDSSFSLSLAGSEAGAGIVYQVSQDAGTSWADTAAAQSSLADGTYLYRALATDAAGNAAASNMVTVTVDTTAPAAGAVTLVDYTDSGLSAIDRISIDSTFSLSLSGQEPAADIAYSRSADSGLTWTAATVLQSGLADGQYQFRADVTDAAGNVATTGAVTVTVDTSITAGTLTLANVSDSGASASDSLTQDSTFDLSLAGTEAGAGIVYQVSQDAGASWADTAAAQAGLPDGTYLYRALATDAAGNAAVSNVVTVAVDTSITAGTLTLANFYDTGASASDGLTQDSTFSFSLSGTEAGAGIVYQVSQDAGTSWVDTATAQSSVADGTYLYRALATDAAGNAAASNMVTVTVDTSITAGTLTLTNVSDSGASASDGLTQDSTFDLSLSGTEAGAGIVYQVSQDAGTSWTDTAAAQAGLPDGTYLYRALATDAAGNAAASNTVTVTVDTSITAGTLTLTNVTDTGASASDGLTQDSTFDLSLSGTEAGAGIVYQVSQDAGTSWADTAAAQSSLADGTYLYRALATDAAGNAAASNMVTVTVDTSITAGTLSLANVSDSGASASDGLTQDSTFSLSLSGTEAGAGIVYQVSQDAGASWTDTVTAQVGLADGTYLYRALATDAAGNAAASNMVTVTIDTSITTGTLTLANVSDSGASASDGLTQDSTFDLSLSGTEAGAGIVYQVSQDAAASWTDTAAEQAGLGDGAYLYRALATDAAGNAAASNMVTVTVDTSITAGTLTLANFTDTGASASDGLTQDSTFDLSLSGTEAGAGIVYQVSQDAGTSWVDTAAAQPSLADGTYLYRAVATDAAGNAAASNVVTVAVDTSITAGTLTLTNFTDSGISTSDGLTQDSSFSLSLSGTEAGAGIVYQVSQDTGTSWTDTAAAQSSLADGTYLYRALATDAAGNAAASNMVTVTVDTTAPAAGVVTLVDYTDSGMSAVDRISTDSTFSLSLSGQEPAADIAYSRSADSGLTWTAATVLQSGLADGQYQFRADVTDAAGNVATTGAVTVTVDTTAPAAGVVTLVDYTDSGTSAIDRISTDSTFSLSLSGQEPAADIAYSRSADSGLTWTAATVLQSGLADGQYQYRAEVTDAAGNVATTGAVTVTVAANPPAGMASIAAISQDGALLADDFATDDNLLVISGTNTALLSGEIVRVSLDGSTWFTATQTSATTWSLDRTAAAALENGAYTFLARVDNVSGVTGTASSQAVIINSAAHAQMVLDLNATSDNGSSTTDNITGLVTPSMTGTVSGLLSTEVAAINAGRLKATLFVDGDNDGVIDAGEVMRSGITMTGSGSLASFNVSMNALPNGSYNVKTALVDTLDGSVKLVGLLDGNALQRLVIDTAGTPSTGYSATANNGLGSSAKNIGDFNGDGYDDFLVTAPQQLTAGASTSGSAYILYGSSTGLPNVSLASLTAAQGIHITSTDGRGDGYPPYAAASTGDLNNDGYADVVMTSHVNDGGVIIWGRGGNVTANINVSTFGNTSTADGTYFHGNSAYIGASVAVGDMNGDGYDDLLVGNIDQDNVWVIFGHAGAAGSASWGNFYLSEGAGLYSMVNGAPVSPLSTALYMRITAGGSNSYAEELASNTTILGDVNGDGINDYLVTSPLADDSTADAGTAYLVFGSRTPLSGSPTGIGLGSLSATQVVTLTGTQTEEWLGGRGSTTGPIGMMYNHPQAAASLSDINGDGIADFAIGSPGWGDSAADDFGAGRVYVLYGKAGGVAWSNINLGSLSGSNGFILHKSSATSLSRNTLGYSISGMGDANGDGISDFVVSAPNETIGANISAGAAYLVYGQAGGLSGAFMSGGLADLDAMVTAGRAVKYTGTALNGLFGSATAFGDWNGDGYADVGIGENHGSTGALNGGSYYAYFTNPANLTQSYSLGNDILAAGGTSVGFGAPVNGVDRITGGAGNDVITGIGTDTTGTTATSTLHDAVYGAVGDDTIGLAGTNFTLIDGGSGDDILRFDAVAGLSLDLAAYGLRVQGFERIDLSTGANTLSLGLADVLRLPDQTGASLHPLLINGGADDTVDLTEAIGPGWAVSGSQTIGAVAYDVWHNATMGSNTNADLLVQQGISVV